MDFLKSSGCFARLKQDVTEGLSAPLLGAFVCGGIYFLLKYKKILSEKISIRLGGLFFNNNLILQQNAFTDSEKNCKDSFHCFMDFRPSSLPSHQKHP